MLNMLVEASELHALLAQNSSSQDSHDDTKQTKTSALIIVDLGKEDRYLSSHIPGAVLVTPVETQAGPPIPGLAPSNDNLTLIMQRIGLNPNSHIIVYDDEGGGWAGRFIWLLDEIGHTQYSYLNGGIHAWAAEGYELESGSNINSRSDIQVQANHQHSITLETLSSELNADNLQVWDARSPKEYSGETVYGARGGHIPGALNYEWTRAMDQQRHLRLKPLDVIKAELQAVGITPEKNTIPHCQSHHRSGLTYLVGKLMGFKNIKAYPGSWGEWGNNPTTSIE
mgnify:FL=1